MQSFLTRQLAGAGLSDGDTLLVAVSGGVDSVVLLHLLHGLREEYDLALWVAHLDHQIRTESSSDADFVRQLCTELELPCYIETQNVPLFAKAQKVSLEMAARQVRRDFLLRVAADVGASLIALAHHCDDQVETFLQRLLRGSGATGLAAMRPKQGCWWRPLLDCSRQQILAYAAQQQIEWVEDASNTDPVYLRNHLRHNLLPQMRELNPQLDERWSELCRQLQDEDDYWQGQVAEILPKIIKSSADGLRLDREQLLALPRALRVRLLRGALQQVRGDLQRLEAVHLNAIDDLLRAERSQAQLDLPDCWVARRYHDLWLRSTPQLPLSDYQLELPVPGELILPCGRILRAFLQDEQQGESHCVAEFSAAELRFPLVVRNWRAGDSFAPAGMQGEKRLKRFFGDQKVELEQRNRVPLLLSAGAIIWLAGERRSRLALAGQSAGQILRLELV